MSSKARRKARRKERLQTDPDYRLRFNRRRHLRKHYGLSLSDYSLLMQVQNGGCAICGQSSKNRTLGVDHDHKTKRVRGLLCQDCNLGLGRFKDSPELLERAASYVR